MAFKTDNLRERFIMSTVQQYKRNFPAEYLDATKVAKETMKSRANAYGMDAAEQMRLRLRLPGRLMRALNSLDNPPFLEEDTEMNWFLMTFPEFRVTKVYK